MRRGRNNSFPRPVPHRSNLPRCPHSTLKVGPAYGDSPINSISSLSASARLTGEGPMRLLIWPANLYRASLKQSAVVACLSLYFVAVLIFGHGLVPGKRLEL